MINLLIGPPGAGKSYEAVVFHILPALQQGRKIITNLPLCSDELALIEPSYPALIDLRQSNVKTEVKKNVWNPFHRAWDKQDFTADFVPFGSIADYADPWRHPENGCGALYVIDECHKPLPAKGTLREVEEWFAEHRHEYADVLLITQSAGKISKAITDSCQVCYRVRKAVALGSSTSYIRKVQDGLKGDVVNEAIRKYKPAYFKLYQSHTRSDSAGSELGASDIVPFWKRWPVIGAGLCGLGVIALLLSGHSANPMTAAASKHGIVSPENLHLAIAPASAVVPVSSVHGVNLNVPSPPVPVPTPSVNDAPFAGLTLHIVGFIESSQGWRYMFSADQNGQPTFLMKQSYLEDSGYTVEKLSPCSARITYKSTVFYANCNTAMTSIAPRIPTNQPSGG